MLTTILIHNITGSLYISTALETNSTTIYIHNITGTLFRELFRTSLPKCLCEIDACPPPLHLLYCHRTEYICYVSVLSLSWLSSASFSLLPFLALLSSLNHRHTMHTSFTPPHSINIFHNMFIILPSLHHTASTSFTTCLLYFLHSTTQHQHLSQHVYYTSFTPPHSINIFHNMFMTGFFPEHSSQSLSKSSDGSLPSERNNKKIIIDHELQEICYNKMVG